MSKRLKVGDVAPDVTLTRSDDSQVALSTLWPDGPVFLSFLRHFG